QMQRVATHRPRLDRRNESQRQPGDRHGARAELRARHHRHRDVRVEALSVSVGYASAIGSHVGMVRSDNQDCGYVGDRLFLVADGIGGHAGGDVASAKVTRAIARLDEVAAPAEASGDEAGDTKPQPSESGPQPAAVDRWPDPAKAAKQLADSLLQAN